MGRLRTTGGATLKRSRPLRNHHNVSRRCEENYALAARPLRGIDRAAPLDAGLNLGHRYALQMADAKVARTLQVVARGLGRLGRERARSGGDITPQQAEALQLIFDRGVLSTSALALLLGIDPSTASRNLAGLERGGFVVRRRGTDDGRQTDVRLTPRGKRVAEAVTAEWLTVYSALLDRLPRSERQRVTETLEVLARVLEGDGP